MKTTIVLAALLSLAATMPAAKSAGETFDVDLSGLADAFLETREDTGLEKRACVRLVCSAIAGPTTTCITYKYGRC